MKVSRHPCVIAPLVAVALALTTFGVQPRAQSPATGQLGSIDFPTSASPAAQRRS